MHIKHIFFDLDHTLWDFEANSAKAFEFIFNENNVSVDLDHFLEFYAPINKKYWKLYREEKVTKPVLRYKRLKESFDHLNYAASDDLIYHLSRVYIDNLPNYNSLFEGTVEVLDYLLPKYKLHIITNGFEEVQTKKLENSNIAHYFDKIITSESVGVKKPNARIFNHALDLARTTPETSMMIGDNYEADIMGAQQIGMSTIFFNSHEDSVSQNNTISISKLIEIKDHL